MLLPSSSSSSSTTATVSLSRIGMIVDAGDVVVVVVVATSSVESLDMCRDTGKRGGVIVVSIIPFCVAVAVVAVLDEETSGRVSSCRQSKNCAITEGFFAAAGGGAVIDVEEVAAVVISAEASRADRFASTEASPIVTTCFCFLDRFLARVTRGGGAVVSSSARSSCRFGGRAGLVCRDGTSGSSGVREGLGFKGGGGAAATVVSTSLTSTSSGVANDGR